MLVRTVTIVGAALALIACGDTPAASPPVQTVRSPVAHVSNGPPSHVAVILMENEEYGNIIGSRDTPYINSLAQHYALATRMYGVAHPSLPNYLALTGGSTFGIESDCTGCRVSSTSVVDQLSRKRLSWKAYMEDLPHPCYAGASAAGYAKRHDPFAYYTRITSDRARCHRIVGLSHLAQDEYRRTLPRFVWITPNLCHDMHDCDPATGDRFLASLVPPLLKALGPRGLLILTWDEGSSNDRCCRFAAGGHIAAILAGGLAKRGARLAAAVDHYSVLQLLDDLFGLGRLRNAACTCTPSLGPLLVNRPTSARRSSTK